MQKQLPVFPNFENTETHDFLLVLLKAIKQEKFDFNWVIFGCCIFSLRILAMCIYDFYHPEINKYSHTPIAIVCNRYGQKLISWYSSLYAFYFHIGVIDHV